MVRRNQAGEIIFHYSDDTDEVVSSLREIFSNTEIGQQYVTGDYVAKDGRDGYEEIVKAAVKVAGGPMISIGSLTHALTLLIDSGELRPKKSKSAPQLSEPEEDNRPRGRDGKLLTAAQIAWGEMAGFAETASADAIRQRKNVDGKFREFVATNLRREMQGEIGDAVVPAGQPTTKVRISKDLVEFARKYNREPISNLRPKGGFVTLEGEQIPWATFNDLLNKATAAGAI
jgi:hypothetical protein